ncbi:alpha/beta hydrolase [Mycobacterium sp. HNNTM2301]|uniref:alpha/beta hydrolase n=1 Tax=Mycobacterium hainanense TaxID=3289775 RepID=UPI0035A70CD3
MHYPIAAAVRAAEYTNPLWRTSLMRGVVPMAVEVITVLALVYAIGWRGRRWRWLWVPTAAAAGVLFGVVAHWYYEMLGLASEPAPWPMWLWVSATGFAAVIAVAGWGGASWWRRNASVFTVSFCLLSAGLTINGWLGYFPTVYTAWGQLTNAPLPGQASWSDVQALQRQAIRPSRGVVVAVDSGDEASGFRHRKEWVYLPPAWFSTPPPRLPALLMLGGEFNTPADWIRAGDAISTLDAFAAAHAGNAPIAVFADATGGFAVDTECVNGPRGNAADHLTADVVPAVTAQFAAAKWGVVGFSSGGTCAVDLAVMHPGTFGAFVDIGGDIAPNAGTHSQTVDRLFGGDAQAWSSFDPSSVITRHGTYSGVSGLFAVPGGAGGPDGTRGGRSRAVGQAAAESLCGLGAAHGLECTIVELPGKHDWPSATTAFAVTLPWLAGRLETPGVPATAMP